MGENYVKFKNLISKKNFKMEEWESEDRNYFAFEQDFKNGPRIKTTIGMKKDDSFVDFSVFNYVKLNDTNKKMNFYERLNELNRNNLYVKFIMDKDNNIMIFCTIPILARFSSRDLIEFIIMTLDIAEKEYPNFMKLLWT